MKIQYNVPVMAYRSRETITEAILPINSLIKCVDCDKGDKSYSP